MNEITAGGQKKPIADLIEGVLVATRVGHYGPTSWSEGYRTIKKGTQQLDRACAEYLVARGFVVLPAEDRRA